jgi:hypothetical protein
MNWNGPAAKGAMREIRLMKRTEAEERNAATPDGRRRSVARAAGYKRHSQTSGRIYSATIAARN